MICPGITCAASASARYFVPAQKTASSWLIEKVNEKAKKQDHRNERDITNSVGTQREPVASTLSASRLR